MRCHYCGQFIGENNKKQIGFNQGYHWDYSPFVEYFHIKCRQKFIKMAIKSMNEQFMQLRHKK